MQVKYRSFAFYRFLCFHKKIVSSPYDSIESSYVITESSIILGTYFLFLQTHVEGFQI